MGAAKVMVFDKLASRLELAKQFGADIVVNVDDVGEKERRDIVFGNTHGLGADVVAELVGAPHVVDEGVRLLRQGGRYLWIGNITPGSQSGVDPGAVVRGAQTVRGVAVYEPWVLPRAIDFLARRKDVYPFDKIISHTLPFSKINEAFPLADQGGAIRVSLRM
jgi:threonine dehydrogenase-like Zn-dependent dehydrogenase